MYQWWNRLDEPDDDALVDANDAPRILRRFRADDAERMSMRDGEVRVVRYVGAFSPRIARVEHVRIVSRTAHK